MYNGEVSFTKGWRYTTWGGIGRDHATRTEVDLLMVLAESVLVSTRTVADYGGTIVGNHAPTRVGTGKL